MIKSRWVKWQHDMNGAFVFIEAQLVDPETAKDVVGGREIFDRMVKHGWILAREKKKKLVRYATEDLKLAVQRMKLEPLPE